MPDRVLLKKYANRRLYDTEKSTYVTLSQVSEIIREGRQVKVVDDKTEEDVTAFILTQIILEEARKNNSLLPVTLLHLVIQYGENVLSEFFEKYLELTIRNYLAYKAALDQQFRNWLEMGKDLFPHAPTPPSPFAPLDSFLDLFSSLGKGAKKDPSSRE
ncbi:MAG: polyhydroxyalkanoate synthesis regulator DNA-binding domain-containing protein [Syntrophobacteraceae bacterium]|jgi:polyhydroxyalkanoate synthesis repressor PhaR